MYLCDLLMLNSLFIAGSLPLGIVPTPVPAPTIIQFNPPIPATSAIHNDVSDQIAVISDDNTAIPVPMASPMITSDATEILAPTSASLPASAILARQREAMEALISQFGYERVQKHNWKWHEFKSKKDDEWVPQYKLKSLTDSSIETVWSEYDSGLDGQFSTREMTSNWETRWRLDSRTDCTRRKKITDLIEDLSRMPNWNARFALQFLNDKYSISSQSKVKHLRTVHAFSDHLQSKSAGFSASILEAAKSYH